VFNTDPFELRVKREFSDGGIGLAQMLNRTNYLALVGGGREPKFPQNKVIIWDDLKQKGSLSLEFLSPILNVLLSRTRIVVVLKNKVHIYAFSSPPTRLAAYDTVDNVHGVAVMSNHIVAFPSRREGQIQIVNLTSGGNSSTTGQQLVSISRAHRGAIRCLCLNEAGTIIASASETGTIIRLHSTTNTSLLHEFRRGLDRAVVCSMAFNPSSTRLAVLSDKGTLHVFDTSSLVHAGESSNRRHVLGKLPGMPQYFRSEWSFVSAHVTGTRGILGWSAEDAVIVVWTAERKWEKYVIVERESSVSVGPNGTPEPPQWELLREAWRSLDF
jgi:WD40 repeat protein